MLSFFNSSVGEESHSRVRNISCPRSAVFDVIALVSVLSHFFVRNAALRAN